ncbi:ABC transporter permease [Streptomyces sp. DSM 44915]|uniref:ABC transporter permease n=1 Tax=Streptomyces chisholmiae TaxID=3075540 RepID=A0ABU2JPE3_9ACTN|nr:ABC transporter permease [Streptomyces sp. DSM 44915]MDT0266078.1 ABC transporter permease [Streptomyces sp. DSM 44915]
MRGALGRLAIADFLDRMRRPAYAVTLAGAVALGYLAVPSTDSRWVIMQLGEYRGLYNSHYVGMATALAGTLWLTFGGFYVARNGVARDESSGVGQLLAATPLSRWRYLASKFLSNVLLLGSMAVVLAGTAVVMQLARAEDRSLEPVPLLLPFLVLTLPMVVVTAAAAVLFETTPVLRTGLGNGIWFFVWLALVLGGQSPSAPLGGTGVHEVAASMGDDLARQGVSLSGGDFSLGLTMVEEPLRTFVWDGFTPDGWFLAGRLAVPLLALPLALLPALWFHRFDPARSGRAPSRTAPRATAVASLMPEPPRGPAAPAGPPRTPAAFGRPLPRLFVGESRLLAHGPPWWWAGVAVVSLAALLAPLDSVSRIVLPLAWLWPLLVWSRLGAQHHEHGVAVLLDACPSVVRRTLAEWCAGLALTAATGLTALVRLLVAGDGAGAAAWVGGVLFVPSLALALGTLSRTRRAFQAVYLPVWYMTANGLPLLDFMGAVRDHGQPAGPHPAVFAGIGLLLLAIVLLTGAARQGTEKGFRR